jgi:hypothetical protein
LALAVPDFQGVAETGVLRLWSLLRHKFSFVVSRHFQFGSALADELEQFLLVCVARVAPTFDHGGKPLYSILTSFGKLRDFYIWFQGDHSAGVLSEHHRELSLINVAAEYAWDHILGEPKRPTARQKAISKLGIENNPQPFRS